MAHTYSNLLVHIVFSTRERVPAIQPGWCSELHAYLGGIVRELGGKAMAVNGVSEHVHLLISVPAAVSLAEMMRVVKANSTLWVKRQHRANSFAWQTGYGAFSVSQSNARAVVQYIANQQEHHRRMSFQEEYIALLKKNGIAYDEKFLWG